MSKLCFILFCLVFNVLLHGCGYDRYSSDAEEWSRLKEEGQNFIIQATSVSNAVARKILVPLSIRDIPASEEMETWFRKFLAYETPTNNKALYAEMLCVKAELIQLTAWRMKSDESWKALSKFLLNVKSQKNPLSSKRRNEIRQKYFSEPSDRNIDRLKEMNDFFRTEIHYQNALAKAERNAEKAFAMIAEWVSVERKLRLSEIFTDAIGEMPEWYRKELEGKTAK